MHNINERTSHDSVTTTLIDDIDSICDDPIGRSLEKRRPKIYFVIWIESLDRPVVMLMDPHERLAAVVIFTREDLAYEFLEKFADQHFWSCGDLSVRRMTLEHSMQVARSIRTPMYAGLQSFELKSITGVLIIGRRQRWWYSL